MSAQLELFGGPDLSDLPAWLSKKIPWGEELFASENKDREYPVELLEPVKVAGGSFTVSLRPVEDGVVLWGVNWSAKACGGGFYPFRKWGPSHAAANRLEAIQNATEYAVRAIRSKN